MTTNAKKWGAAPMPEKDPGAVSVFGQVLTFLWVIALSCWGGLVNYLQQIKRGRLRFSIARLAIELATSSFVGLLTYLLCQEAGMSQAMTAVMAAIAGHMGTRAIMRLETLWSRLLGGEPHHDI